MIIEKDGRYYIALNKAMGLEDIANYQNALLDILKTATQSDLFNGAYSSVYCVCDLLQSMMLTVGQMSDLEFKRTDGMFNAKEML